MTIIGKTITILEIRQIFVDVKGKKENFVKRNCGFPNCKIGFESTFQNRLGRQTHFPCLFSTTSGHFKTSSKWVFFNTIELKILNGFFFSNFF